MAAFPMCKALSLASLPLCGFAALVSARIKGFTAQLARLGVITKDTACLHTSVI